MNMRLPEMLSAPPASGRGKSADAFRTISEVATELEVPQHVLRFWESKFPHVRPLKRAGGRRYYRPDDVALLRRIRQCLYEQGYTIKGVQKLFRDGALKSEEPRTTPPQRQLSREELRQVIVELRRELAELREMLREARG
jgi:DNA-binding transcriptional MerR regulator